MPPTAAPLLAPFHVHDVITQYRILDAYYALGSGPPVPRPVLIETDPSVIGAPFFLMERIESDPWGDWGTPDWLVQFDDDLRSSVSAQIVGMYTQLHNLGPLEALGWPLSNREELARWADPVRDIAGPALREAFALLAQTVPEDQPPAPCHGDAKIANILWRDGKIAAMLDYEMSFNGDPRWDLGALLEGLRGLDGQALPATDVHGIWGRERMKAAWSRGTGRSLDRELWFEAAGRARYAAILTYGVQLVAEGKSKDDRFAIFGPTAERLSQIALERVRLDAA
jgi:aminoglycoside phosphotransferase (APT) family kinase protein